MKKKQTHVTPKDRQLHWKSLIGLLPFFLFIAFFLVMPSLTLFSGAFQDSQGNFTLANFSFLKNTFALKSYLTSIWVSLITSLIGGIFGFFVAYAITARSHAALDAQHVDHFFRSGS